MAENEDERAESQPVTPLAIKAAELHAEVARLQERVEGAEAQSELRGETLLELTEVVHRAEEHSGAFGTCQASPCRDMRAAIDISPKEAKEKEGR